MEMKEIHANASYKVLSVNLAKGEEMPRHYASSDAFLVIREGKAVLKLQEREVELGSGSTLHIPAKEPHSLHVLEDFAATVVLAAGAQINFINSQ
ncbi:cupin domain-containing protein [Pontibacter amylolyticus]|uniref:Cupin type-2 domain-containing protein n=1 Tax=Pontibacter amylolyticus TaxID=1424080 RepID=A0ABQ1WFH5_9BACT|nr:cupin domain-containing protein [Pontibacter amylolyticus]GGG27722.1 hypothetical protein GCM10011323_34020 [Pontibacter amylolyticus]